MHEDLSLLGMLPDAHDTSVFHLAFREDIEARTAPPQKKGINQRLDLSWSLHLFIVTSDVLNVNVGLIKPSPYPQKAKPSTGSGGEGGLRKW